MAATIDAELESIAGEREERDVHEPIGIVISRGSREEPTPAFFSYEWSAPPRTRPAPRRRRTV